MEQQMEARPPEILTRFVRVLVPPANREHVLGDLAEQYKSPRQYLIDALITLPFLIGTQLRRTQHPAAIAFEIFFFWFGVFYGSSQSTWAVAAIPTATALIAMILRDVYRGLTPVQPRQAVIDTLTFAGATLLSQAVVAVLAPDLLLSPGALYVGFPMGCVLVFVTRRVIVGNVNTQLQAANARSLTREQLVGEVHNAHEVLRRQVRVEMGAGVCVSAGFAMMCAFAPDVTVRSALALIAAGGAFIASYLIPYARARPMRADLGFDASLAHYRDYLQRMHQLYRTALWWYVLPLAIGAVVLVVALAMRSSHPLPTLFAGLALVAVLGLSTQQVMWWAACKVQRRLDQLSLLKERS
jgi:hypothetical protein